MIWDPLPRTSISVDYWKIKRKNEINQQQVDAAIAAGSVARDPTSVSGIPGDPGAITAVLTRYVNSAQTKVRGIDVDARYVHKLPRPTATSASTSSTPIFEWLRTEQDGTSREFAGTHGNCDVTNCTGTPDNKANLRFGWDRNDWRVSLNVNYRGKMDNTFFRGDPDGCASHFANGNDAPNGCELASFTTSTWWRAGSRRRIGRSSVRCRTCSTRWRRSIRSPMAPRPTTRSTTRAHAGASTKWGRGTPSEGGAAQ
jgi:iron complex outermembrane receptor protein